jgi:hypothetical protein
MIKTRLNFKLCGENIILKIDLLIGLYNFTVAFNQTTFIFLTTQNTNSFFTPHNSHNGIKQILKRTIIKTNRITKN